MRKQFKLIIELKKMCEIVAKKYKMVTRLNQGRFKNLLRNTEKQNIHDKLKKCVK